MHVKRKSIFFLITIIGTLILTLTAFPPVVINTGSQIQEITDDNNIIAPKTAGAIQKIEFIQPGGNTFDYLSSNPEDIYFKTGDGPFKLRLHILGSIGGGTITIRLNGYDPNYHAELPLDPAMMDEIIPPELANVLSIVLGIQLPSLSQEKTYGITHANNYVSNDGTTWIYDLDIPNTDEYQYSSLYLINGDPSYTPIIQFLLALVGVDLNLDQFEYIQDIKNEVINYFSITGSGISNFVNYDNIIVPNEDHSAPDYNNVTWSHENIGDDWEIKLRIEDEFMGSGTDYEEAYIYYSVNGGDFEKKPDPLLLDDDGYLKGSIPNQLSGSEIKFYVNYTDRAGNAALTETFTFWAEPFQIEPLVYLLIGIAVVTIGVISATRIYRNRHQPRVITLPTKKKVDKYYKKVKNEGGNI